MHLSLFLILFSDSVLSLSLYHPSTLARLAINTLRTHPTLGQGPYDVKTECEDQF